MNRCDWCDEPMEETQRVWNYGNQFFCSQECFEKGRQEADDAAADVTEGADER